MNLDDLRSSEAAVITVAEAASVLDVDVRTISRAVQNGELPALRLGRRVLIPRLELLARLGAEPTNRGDVGKGRQKRSPEQIALGR